MDIQTLVAILCVLAAVFFMGRKAYDALRRGSGGCGCGCSCGKVKAGQCASSNGAGQPDGRQGPRP